MPVARGRQLIAAVIAVVSICAAAGAVSAADENAASLDIADVSVSTGIDRDARSPLGAADSFPADCGNLFCFTRVRGAADTSSVTHVWYRGGEVMARVVLPVRSADWRTWSSKMILPTWTGDWEVKVLDPMGVVLASEAFNIVDDEQPAPGGEGGEQ